MIPDCQKISASPLPCEVLFQQGTLILHHPPQALLESLCVRFDSRTLEYRVKASHYRQIILWLRAQGVPYHDNARAFGVTPFPLLKTVTPREHQAEALKKWQHNASWGTVVMPTGSGKTILAVLAVAATQRPTLIHVPTLDLLAQWERTLTEFFGDGIGVLCGDTKRLGPITVATYDSALNFAERNGNKFGLLVFDECHHLPGEQYRFVGQASIAPFRLGLTATPPEAYRLDILQELTGAIVHEIRIDELKGGTLAPYDVITLSVDLSDEEQKSYDENRKVYREFLVESGVRMASIDGWQQFLRAVARHPNGRAAFKAYRTQKKLAESSPSKEPVLASLLQKHAGERILIFTQDTETAYRIGRNFLLPVITNQTHSEERKEWLQLFRSGDITILVTAKVLNEGVDLPEASVGVVYSGSGTTREHVQRLGRILRASPGKRAIFYELIAANTGERFVNDRRRKHHAYQQT